VQSHIRGSTCLIDRRHRTHCAANTNGKRWRVEGTKFGHPVCGIDNHLCLLDEWQIKDGLDGDIATRHNKKACGVPLSREVRKVEPEHHRQFGGEKVAIMLDNTTQHDGRVVGWAVDGCNGVGIGFGKGGKEMEVAVDRTAAVLTTQWIAGQFSSPRAEPSCRVM
jgi:hypothetical protein